MSNKNKANRFISIIVALALTLGSYVSAKATGKIYYVSTTGNDNNPGTASAPFLTFKRAISALAAGDELQIYGGVYAQELDAINSGTSSAYISIKPVSGQRVVIDGGLIRNRGVYLSGNYITLEGVEVQRALTFCVDVTGSNVTVRGVAVHDCYSSGLRVKGKNDVIENSALYNNSTKNSGGTGSSWGIALRVMLGGENVTLRNNKVYNNWGEGLGILQAKYVNILNNTVYDNYSQNIYIDNAMDIKVENNFVYSLNPAFYRAGLPANCISMAEEYYDGWGAQLARIRIVNNIVAFCRRGIGYTYAEVTNGGLDTVTIANNTIWKTAETGIVVINQTTKTRNSVIANNIVQQDSGKLADIQPTSGISTHHNFWGSPVVLLNHASGTGDRTGDVKLAIVPTTNPTTFRLSSSSPAIGGAADLGITNDFEGKSRTSPYDMGAIEYGGTVSTAPSPTPSSSGSTGGGTYDDTNSAWRYTGGWLNNTVSGAYNNTLHYSSTVGSYAEISFTGTSFTYIYPKASNRGLIDVYVDGKKITTLNAYDPSIIQQVKWNSPTFTNAAHLARFVHAGGGTYIDVDAIQINSSTSTSSSSSSQSSVNIHVSNGNDDVEENASGSMYLTSSDLELVYDGSNQVVGIRFRNVTIPQNASILNAYIQFQTAETTTTSTSLTVRGELSPNASAFGTTSQNVSSRTKTSQSVNWSPASWSTLGATGSDQRTPDLKGVVQEMVNQSNWASGNAMVFILTGTGKRVAESYEGNSSGAPLLHIDYSTTTTLSAAEVLSVPLTEETQPTETPVAPPSPTAIETVTETVSTPTPEPIATEPSATFTMYDDKDSVFTYSGDWSDVDASDAYNGSFKKSLLVGQSATMTFTGRSISLFYTTNSTFGKVDVLIDGVLVGTIDQYSASRQIQQKWDLPVAIADGPHTLTLVHQGAADSRISIDAVAVYP